jgi:Rrf2 family protein
MIRFSKKVEYALMALKFISASNPRLVTAREISDKVNIPYDLLSKILQRLKSEKILSSTQGTHGGYLLASSPDKIFLYEIMRAIDGDRALTECLISGKEGECGLEDSCSIKSPVTKLQREVEELFKSKTISDFV